MSKFKVGDKVRVIEHPVLGKWLFMEDRITHNSFVPDMMRLAEQVVTISAIEMDLSGMEYRIEEDGGKWHWVDEMFSGLATEPREFIVVRRSGSDVIASHKRGDEIVKTAKAKCAPSDEFNFETGAKLAFDRLMGREEPKPAPQPAPKFKVGDRVVTKFGSGTIVEINHQCGITAYTVEHDKADLRLHDGSWNGECGKHFALSRCSFQTANDLYPAPEPKYYTGKVVCIKNKTFHFQVTLPIGRVFEIKNGELVTPLFGETITVEFVKDHMHKIKSISDLNERMYGDILFAEVKD